MNSNKQLKKHDYTDLFERFRDTFLASDPYKQKSNLYTEAILFWKKAKDELNATDFQKTIEDKIKELNIKFTQRKCRNISSFFSQAAQVRNFFSIIFCTIKTCCSFIALPEFFIFLKRLVQKY